MKNGEFILAKDVIIPLVTLILGTFLGTLVSYINKSRDLQDSLDARSNWRVNLVDIASKEYINMDDVYRLRSALRNVKHNPLEVELYSFDFMTNVMINICQQTEIKYEMVATPARKKEKDIKKTLVRDFNDREIIRICCRFLLKHQWEYLTKSYKNPLLKKLRFNSITNDNALETCNEILKYGGKIDYV